MNGLKKLRRKNVDDINFHGKFIDFKELEIIISDNNSVAMIVANFKIEFYAIFNILNELINFTAYKKYKFDVKKGIQLLRVLRSFIYF